MINLGNLDLAEIEVKIDLADGQLKKLKLRRKSRIPESLRSPTWFTSLKGFGLVDIRRIRVSVKSATLNENILLQLQ